MDWSISSICSYISRKIPTWNSEYYVVRPNGPKIDESYGDQAALQYDEKFRRWRQKNPATCLWQQQKNAELYQEALVLGLDYKLKSKKQQSFRAPLKHRYCYAYNNHGTCPKDNACPHPHVCQICAGKHCRKLCPKFKQKKYKQFTRDPSSSTPKPPPQSKSKITTQINQKVLAHYLKGYDQTLSNLLIEGFKFGFKIPYQVLRQFLQICLPLKERNLF